MIKEIWEDLQKQANYAVASKNKELMHEAYGAAKMARKSAPSLRSRCGS